MRKRLRIRPWLIPLLIGLVVSAVGWWAQRTVERAIRDRMAEELVTVLDTEVAALKFWFDGKRAEVEKIARLPGIEEDVIALARLTHARPDDRESLLRSPALKRLQRRMEELVSDPFVRGYAVLDPSGRIIAARQEAVIGGEIAPAVREPFAQVRRGRTVVAGPLRYPGGTSGDTVLTDLRAIFVATPVLSQGGRIGGAVVLRYSPEDDLSQLLALVKLGETGQSYAFNADGVMVSASRFAEQLRHLGLVQTDSGNTILAVHIRDPGRNLTTGAPLSASPASLPLTKSAAEATAGRDGSDLAGYRDFRGVPVVGAWRWIGDHGLGVVTEMEVEEAYQTLYVVRRGFWALVGLLVLGAFGAFIYNLLFHDLSTRVRKAEKLGQYTLEEKIGEGGMGAVYKARHAMLRRPTAVKLIKSAQVKAETLVRFEREVQLTSQLSNPNTVAIYDFGRTPNGVFYYAMEYLPGITLEALVHHEGPLPERRVVHLLRQISSSLAEAHSKGLVHRDIKPANIMVLERGGLFDVVKVLDFGLVKEINGADGNQMVTAANTIPGTPHFLAPEAIERPDGIDARSDLYALGAVGYYLLTGTHVFTGRTPLEVLGHHLRDAPQAPSERLGRNIDPYLEALILRLLAKAPEDRLRHAGEVVDALSSGFQSPIGVWTQREAASWWQTSAIFCRGPECEDGELAINPTLDVDIADRVSEPTP